MWVCEVLFTICSKHSHKSHVVISAVLIYEVSCMTTVDIVSYKIFYRPMLAESPHSLMAAPQHQHHYMCQSSADNKNKTQQNSVV